MAVVVRLQGLNISAGPEDIRRFFHGLPIPEGGVHIIGGKVGEAFIIFSTERAGQLAMLHSGKRLSGSTVILHKSSMAEFTNKMRLKLKRQCPSEETEPAPQTASLTEFYTTVPHLASAVQGLQAKNELNQAESPRVGTSRLSAVSGSGKIAKEEWHLTSPVTRVKAPKLTRHHKEEQPEEREVKSCKPGYLRLYGLPDSITKDEVFQFFEGLEVMDVITDTLKGPDQCCLVKMASFKEAKEGLKYSHSSSKEGYVMVRLAHERMWVNATAQRKSPSSSAFTEQVKSSPDTHAHTNSHVKKCHLDASAFEMEYYIMVKNLPNTITKTEVKNLFSCPDVPNGKILHQLNKWNKRTSTVFIIFTRPEEYTLAMNMNGSVVGSQVIDISSITKEKMNDLLNESKHTTMESSRLYAPQAQPALSCIYARNFPAAVRKEEVKDFFRAYDIGEKDIELLQDEHSNSLGQAVIRFGCEDRARDACSLHGKHFKQEPILLTCISEQQMKDILHKTC